MNKYEKTLDWLTWRFIEPMKPIPACIDKNLSYYNWVCPTCGELHVNRTKEKHFEMLEKMNKQIFEDNHKANQRIMQLEEENAYLRHLSCD